MLIRNITLLLFLVGCGGKTIEGDDAGTNDGAPTSDAITIVPSDATTLPDASLACNTIDPGTKTVSIMQVAQTALPIGGTATVIQPGLYELTSFTLYTGPNGSSGSGGSITGRVRVNVGDSAEYIFQAAIVQDNQAPAHSNSGGNSAGPGALSIAQTCPTAGPATMAFFHADSSSFTIQVSTGNQTADETFDFVSP